MMMNRVSTSLRRTLAARAVTSTSAALQRAVRAPVRNHSDNNTAMFCFQCEQTEDTHGCTVLGVCGKTPEVSRLQDFVMEGNKAIAMYAHRARELGAKSENIDRWMLSSLFSTMTNVNFDQDRFVADLNSVVSLLAEAKALYEDAAMKAGVEPERLPRAEEFRLLSHNDVATLSSQAHAYSIPGRQQKLGDDYVSLQELITYGLKGMCAYAQHALVVGEESEEIYAFVHKTLDFLTREDATTDELLATALAVGEMNYKVMEMLDGGHTTRYGHPEPTEVRMTGIKGKAILVSGHDLHDLEKVLKQTEGTGINVYSHGELLPANSYPELKKYKHFVGNYGGPWQDQKIDFAAFPGSILMTTNCLIQPSKYYKKRLFTRSVTGWPGVTHLDSDDFTPLIEAALEEEGFEEDEPKRTVTGGFARNAVLGVAPQVVEAVKGGAIKHFFVIGGCDGTEAERSYFTNIAEGAPDDTVVLTLGCGKYRLLHRVKGDIGGIPRLLDAGQCNDAYSVIQIALALSGAFGVPVNDLPVSLVISWFEQKAVAVLLTLLHLNLQNIYLGPNLPAFITPNVLGVLVDKFNITPGDHPSKAKAHLAQMLKVKEEEL